MSYNNLEISKMTLNDLEAIRDILIYEFDDFWNLSTFEEELNSNNSYYFVAKCEGNIVGFAGLKKVLDEADIMNIVTIKKFRNSGIGSALFEHLINFSKENGIHKLTLEVDVDNIPAICIYEKFGFKKIALRENYYSNSHNAIIMQLDFDTLQ